MLKKWSETGLGSFLTEHLSLSVTDEEELGRIREEIQELNSVVRKYGIRFGLKEGKKEDSILSMEFSLDKLKRAAGKKRDYGSTKRVSDVFCFKKEHSSKETAEYAGVRLRTYQRRVKKYKEEGRWNEENSSFF